uniref:Uncharacterized protein n=1 Tax=Romanomermis culicivorax TaxID=13658 RepID=A0A915I079_ROMCU
MLKFTQTYPEDSAGDPESSSPANLENAITTRSMTRKVEKNDQAQVQPDGNQGQSVASGTCYGIGMVKKHHKRCFKGVKAKDVIVSEVEETLGLTLGFVIHQE